MKVIDPGHVYELSWLDGQPQGPAGFEEKGCPYCCAPNNQLTFVKREGDRYPGNVGSHAGTTMQEVLRALINRVRYVNNQIPHSLNDDVIESLEDAIWSLELRAAERHGREFVVSAVGIAELPTCNKCGHIGCEGACHP